MYQACKFVNHANVLNTSCLLNCLFCLFFLGLFRVLPLFPSFILFLSQFLFPFPSLRCHCPARCFSFCVAAPGSAGAMEDTILLWPQLHQYHRHHPFLLPSSFVFLFPVSGPVPGPGSVSAPVPPPVPESVPGPSFLSVIYICSML